MAKTEKKKETPWTEQKMMYKDGNVDVYRKFGWETWKRMTKDERAMWTEQNESTPAPISKEVIEFNKKVAKQLDEVEVPNDPLKVALDEKLEAARAECKERGIKFAYNSKLPTLQKKLADADNPE